MLQSIQIARALAVLAVLSFHLTWVYNDIPGVQSLGVPRWLHFGDKGVDLFFCISGFIIAHIIAKEQVGLREFYVRRFYRIYPFYAAFTLLFLALAASGCAVGLRDKCSSLFEPFHIVSSLLILPQKEFPVLGVGWSLEHEIVFYLIAGIVCIGLRASLRTLAVTLGALWCIGILVHVLLPVFFGLSIKDFHLFSLYHIEFLAGILVYLYWNRFPQLPSLLAVMLGAVGFIATTALEGIAGAIEQPQNPVRSGLPALIAVCGGAISSGLVVFGLLRAEAASGFRRGGIWQGGVVALVFIGNISYALYLAHPIVFGVMGKFYKVVGMQSYFLIPALLAAILMSIAAAAVWYLFVERPFLRVVNSKRRKAQAAPSY